MIGAPINELTSSYASFMGAGKPNGSGKGEGDNAFADLMNSVSEGVDVVKELTPVSKQDASGMGTDTGMNKDGVDVSAAKKTEVKETAPRKSDETRDEKPQGVEDQTDKKVADEKDVTTKSVSTEKETAEIPEETLETLASSMISAIMDILSVTEEEANATLESMDIQISDLLNPETLKEFVLNLKADGDASALLTDENLLGSLKDVEGAFEEIVNTVAKELKLPAEEVREAIVSFETDRKDMEGSLSEKQNVTVTSEDKAARLPEKETSNVEVKDNSQTVIKDETSGVSQPTLSKTGETSEKEEKGLDKKEQNQEDMQFSQNTEISAEYKPEDVTKETPEAPMLSQQAREIYEQIRDQIRVNTNDGLTELQMKLNPENLGNVHLTLTAREGAVTAHFGTENDAVRQALEMQIAQLKENLEHQGVKVEAVEVTVSSHGFEQNLEQGNEQSLAQEKEKEALRKATRKINLLGDMAGEEELGEEEAVTVDMMKADGNSMDYKA